MRDLLRALWTAWAVLILIAAAELAVILLKNSGHLIYTVDDAYIHLALAENLAAGHYGVNAGEVSSASSSILWPILLTPFAALPYGHLAPLLLNLAAAWATLYFYGHVVAASFPGSKKNLVAILLLLIPATNLIGLVFLGMEHSLQVLLVAAVVWGLIEEVESGRAAPWIFPAIVAAGLVRYESLAVALPALAFLFLRGHRKASLVAAAVLVTALGAFSAVLLHLGLAPLPSSVLLKSPVLTTGGAGTGPIANLSRQLTHSHGILLSLSMLLLVAVAAFGKNHKREERLFAATIALAVTLHLLFGRNGYQRYEVYMCTAAFLTLLYLVPKSLAVKKARSRFFSTERVILLAMVVLAIPYGATLFKIPLASNNIYEQHYQMHRFAVECYKRPVAVIDLGYVSYRNDHYVLDLSGLGSAKIFHHLRTGGSRHRLAEILRAHDVRLAMVFHPYFIPPEGWHQVGRLRLGKARVAPAASTVWFYAQGADTSREVRSLLRKFRPTLPPGVGLDILPARDGYSGTRL